MRRACPKCGRVMGDSGCPVHPPRDPNAPRSRHRDNARHLRFRRAVKRRDGYRCIRCGRTEDLRACHLIPLHQGGTDDMANGVTLCKDCDKATDKYAR